MNKIEKLVQRMRDEEARKAVKPIRAKVVKVKALRPVRSAHPTKPVVPEPERLEWVETKPTLREAIASLTPEQASSEKNVATVVALHVIESIMRSPRQFDTLSAKMSSDLAWLTAEPWTAKVNLKRMFSTALVFCDSLECRGQSPEGSGIKALHEIEKILLERKIGRAS
jgi:hypothetical protein